MKTGNKQPGPGTDAEPQAKKNKEGIQGKKTTLVKGKGKKTNHDQRGTSDISKEPMDINHSAFMCGV